MIQVTEKLGVIVFDGAAISTCSVGGFATVKARTRPRAPVLVKITTRADGGVGRKAWGTPLRRSERMGSMVLAGRHEHGTAQRRHWP